MFQTFGAKNMVGKYPLRGFRLHLVQNEFENEELQSRISSHSRREKGRAFTNHLLIAIVQFQDPSPFKQRENLVRGDRGVLRPSAAAE